MKDFLGQHISIGDSVIYPNRQKSQMWMNLASVTDVQLNLIIVRRDKDGAVKRLTRVDRVTVVTKQIEGHVVNILDSVLQGQS